MSECAICAIPLSYREKCPSPACPCFGTRAGTAEMGAAAAAWRIRPSVAQRRTLDGQAALDHLERMAELEYRAAVAALADAEIVHRVRP